ncbi:Ig-like domain-containing protein [Pontibacter cellulosilyticus]|uniref:Gliding motility-associated C-terminal domain-containing protein n=1 Tax=Pontibacter cellulosilyticus TaxID=1720253 RepID=A0A923N745_9BACT|nr:gliding motility-associated C-terminal domain-containing protein [Pontibacter cellulosilyticus]MBC5993409.1 gliding motility-associated C-terminal domain-containing protein [Pontibacter cellulosilyticus]
MAKRFLLLLLPFFLCFTASATHIVGGEFELRHISDNNYRLFFNLYFDQVNGSPGARDMAVNVNIFEKGTNSFITSIRLPFRSESAMNYTNVGCTTSDIKTTVMLYYEDVFLDPAIYTNAAGYYAVWERCCRNNTVTNISEPGSAGTTFYMEFPAVVKNGNAFRNSSPKLSPPPNDYACVDELFYYNFGSTDADGDQLVYDLVTPLNGNSSPTSIIPPPTSGPYQEISWLSGYSKDQQIQGDPAVTIDEKTGRLTVKPAHTGLFVFGVRCQEYRNGVKIGEVRRDFQLLVKACRKNEDPIVSAITDGAAKTYKEGELIRITPTSSRCIKVYFTDPDKDETLRLTTKPVNFNNNYFSFKGVTTGMVNTAGGEKVLEASLCLDRCFDTKGQTYLLDLIVSDNGDNGCGLPKTDTLRLSMVVEPMPDKPPGLSFSTNKTVYTVDAGDVLTFDVTGRDPDNEEVIISAQGKGFDLSSQGITFDSRTGVGTITSPFTWQITCETIKQPSYQIEFKVVSPTCGNNVTRTEIVEIKTKQYNITNNTASAGQTICTGESPIRLTGSLPAGGNAPYVYTWEMSTAGASNSFTPAPGANNAQHYSPPALTQTTWYRRKVTSGLCTESISEAVKVTVNELISNNVVSGAQTICTNTAPAILTGQNPSGGNGTYTYRWEYSHESESSGFKPAPGTNNQPQYQPGALTQTTWYRRVAISDPCPAVPSQAVKITVVPVVTENIISESQLVCYDKTTKPLAGNQPKGGTGTYTYRWEYSTTSATAGFATAPGNNTGATYTSGPLTQKTWFRRVVGSAPCESISNVILATVDPLPDIPLARGATVCPNETATITASTPVSSYKLEWYDQPTGGDLLHTGSSYTTPALAASKDYYVQTVNSNGCACSPRVKVTATVAPPAADAGKDKTIIQGKQTELRATGGTKFSWSPAAGLSDPNIATPVASPRETTTYKVTVTSEYGCVSTDEVTITVLPRIEPTNAITLNGDNVNDTWHIRNIEYYPNCKVKVFTRWGNLIYDSKGYQEPWNGMHNGKPLPMAAYYYVIDLGMEEEPISGSITLIK